MRSFKCYDCQHEWELPFGRGGRGVDQNCPECGSENIHRLHKSPDRGRGRGRGGLGWGPRRRGVADLGEREGGDESSAE